MSDTPKKSAFTVELASRKDDGALRQLLRNNPMPGNISLTLEREPSFFLGSTLEGDNHKTFIVRKAGEIVALGTASSRMAYINGQVERLGYLSQLRVDKDYRGLNVIRAGYRKFAELHSQLGCRFYVTTIVSDNLLARRVLEKDWKPKPHYEPYGRLSSLVLPLRRNRKIRLPQGVVIRNAEPQDMSDIARCLNRSYSKYQFAPYFEAETLHNSDRTRGLKPQDFLVAIREKKIIGCLATWDQQNFKQTVVLGYHGKMSYLRPFYNIAAPFIGLPHLPPRGSTLPHAYISFMAADDNDSDVFLALLNSAFNAAKKESYSYLTLGLTDTNPLLNAVKRNFKHLEYESIIYLAYFKGEESAAQTIEHGIPHLELAIL